MKFRHGLVLLTVLTMTVGCSSVEPTTQTSMLRGPTPSSGMSIRPLLQVPGGTSDPAAESGDSAGAAPAESGDPAATSTDQPDAPATDPGATDDPGSDPAGTDPAGTDPAGTEDPLTDPTDEFDTALPNDTTLDPAGGTGSSDPDLEALAASFSCLDYAPQSPEPAQTAAGSCLLDEDQVLLYSFATDLGGCGVDREDQGGPRHRLTVPSTRTLGPPDQRFSTALT
jgi:hypothetical protein